MKVKWEQRLWYLRLTIAKEDLQTEVLQRFGVMLSDPETLVGLLADELIPWGDAEVEVEVYEEPSDSEDDLVVVVELYRTG